MRDIMKRGLSVLLVLVVVAGLMSGFVAAQNDNQQSGNGFRISPVRTEYTIDKGKSETLAITIENTTDIPTTALGVVNDFIASDREDGEPRLILDNNAPSPRNSFKKLVPQIGNVELGPREKKDVQITVAVPEDAHAGGYYGAVRYLPSVTNNAGNVGLTASVGTLVLVRVPGDLTEKLDLVQLNAAQKGKSRSLLINGDVSILTRLKNSGDIHVQPFGKIQIKNMLGKIVREYELNSTDPRANILPDSIRRFEDAVEKPKGGWFGRYTIQANIGFSQGGGELITASTSFWYLPVWFLIVLLLLVMALVGGVFWIKNRHATKQKHKKQ